MGNQIIQSIKTIAQSLVDNAGYDKTRGGFIVGVNSVTNTYSVKVDGVTYPIVRAVDDATYNIGDVVKVVIPCNQATQMYISSSILSDNSLGNKIANAVGLAQEAKQLGLDNQVEIKDVSDVVNSARTDINNLELTKIDRFGTNASMKWDGNVLKIEAVDPETNVPYAVEIGGNGIEFKYDNEAVAMINQDQLVIDKTVVLTEMQVNRYWTWRTRDNNNLCLQWIGGSN